MAQSNRSAASYVAEARNTKPLSDAMFNWAKANMSKLKSPTAAQKKIFAKYKAMVKAGNTPANPKPKPAPSKPRQTTPAEAKERFYRSSSQGSIAKNEEKAKRNFFRSSSGTRGQNMPSQPALKGKPKRSSYPAGRAGQAQYAAALRRYNKPATTPKRRPRLSIAERRRARRGGRR